MSEEEARELAQLASRAVSDVRELLTSEQYDELLEDVMAAVKQAFIRGWKG